MKKTLYIHIGEAKTGTSSLQEFCRHNWQTLSSRFKIYYPFAGAKPTDALDDAYPASHHMYLFNKVDWWHSLDGYSAMGYTSSNVLEPFHNPEAWQELARETKAYPEHDILVSYEGFDIFPLGKDGSSWFNNQWREEIQALFPDRYLKLICYVRRIDDFFNSFCTHVLKNMVHQFTDTRCAGALGYTPEYSHMLNAMAGSSLRQTAEKWGEYVKVMGRENVIFRLYDRSTLKNGDIIEDFFFHIFGVDVRGLPAKRENERVADSNLPLLRILYQSAPDMQQTVFRDLYNRVVNAASPISEKNALTAAKLEFAEEIDKIDALIPGYKELFAKRDLALGFPDLEIEPETAAQFNLLFSLYSRQADRDYCDLHNRIVEGANTAMPLLFPVPWPSMRRLQLHKTGAGRLSFTLETAPNEAQTLFGTAAQKVELALLEAILGNLGWHDAGVCAFERAFHDYRGKTPEQRLISPQFKVGYLPFELQARLVLPGQFLLGHLSAQAVQNIPDSSKPLLIIRDLRQTLLSYLCFQELRAGRNPATATLRPELLFDNPHDSLMIMLKELPNLLPLSHVIRFEELMSGDRTAMQPSLAALSAATGRSENAIYAAVKAAPQAPIMVVAGRGIASGIKWTDDLERVFQGYDLHIINERLGYSRVSNFATDNDQFRKRD